MTAKKLIITGCGLKALSHLTRENENAIEQADLVLYLVNEPITAQWIKNKSKKNESLEDLYFSEKYRVMAYKKIVDYILLAIAEHNNICVVVYGHPLLLSNSIEHLIRNIDRNTIDLYVLPAISAFDCLLADLEIDPGKGCFTIEANELINNDKHIDPTNHLIIWQVGLIDSVECVEKKSESKIDKLKYKLLKIYNAKHQCIFYEASMYPHFPFKKWSLEVSNIDRVPVSRLTTAYIPPIPL